MATCETGQVLLAGVPGGFSRGNTLHVATICLAPQLFLFIVDFQQYFCHIECDGYDVEN